MGKLKRPNLARLNPERLSLVGQRPKLIGVRRLKLVVLCLFVAFVAGVLLTGRGFNRTAAAYSSGPPAGYTHAPGEFDCAECHVPDNAGTGKLTIDAPQKYVPGQTYQITVNHTNADPTRLRWGFQLTALDDADQRAGTLAAADALTQVLDNQGVGGARQYIEHTQGGTFKGQTGGASWTFRWTAPATDVGPVTFYAAGNQANGDDNTSGDNIYFTFVASVPQAAAPDYSLSVSPAARTVTPGGMTTYNVTVAPSGGFKGQVNLSVSGLPAGASAAFNPTPVNLDDSSARTSTLTITTDANTPLGDYQLAVTGTSAASTTSGSISHTAQATLRVVSPASADLSISKTDSPDPASIQNTLTYTITVTNNGPATASGVFITDTLPSGIDFIGAGEGANATLGGCTVSSGTGAAAEVGCSVGTLAAGEKRLFTILVRPLRAGTLTNSAVVHSTTSDFDAANNSATATTFVEEQGSSPRLLVPNLALRTVVSGLDMPTSMAFLGADDLLVLEKNTGKVRRVTGGQIAGTPLDLAVNNASERGLLGIVLHPSFAVNKFVYLYWTESSTGADTGNVDEVPLLGNRVDRYVWTGQTLVFDRNLIRLRALQQDAGQPSRGNHNGGVLRFGADGKLYVVIGDNGRRGLLQNLPCGANGNCSGTPAPDDQFGGPAPDDAHLTGVVLRLNDDGTTPADNPFASAATPLTGEAATNVKKIFAYGIRNSFGMDFDPLSGKLWTQENGDDSFDELNRVEPGFNGGWIQLMGPASRVAQYRDIETTRPGGLQQNRWSPALIAATPEQALQRLYALPGSHYADPEFSWKYAIAPSPIGFVRGRGLGAPYEGDLFVGASRTTLLGGYLLRLDLSADRLHVATTDARLQDRVADNLDKFDLTESESLLVGRDFGVTTDIQTGLNGHLYVVSLSNGAIYEIYAQPALFLAHLDGAQETPPNDSAARGIATIFLDPDETTARVSLSFTGLGSAQTDAHIHGAAAPGTSAAVLFALPHGAFKDFQITLTPAQVQDLKAGLLYVNVHSAAFPSGEIRGQLAPAPTANPADDAQFFVRQHYLDFLNREPDAPGLAFWTNQITECETRPEAERQTCREVRRINVSAAFFLSIEFQQTGYLVYRFYDASFDRQPHFNEFLPDTQEIGRVVVVGAAGWEAQLETNRREFAEHWVERPEFKSIYDALTDAQYVDRLFANAGVTPTTAERDALVAGLAAHTETRATVLRRVAEHETLRRNEFNRAFVLMEYFGYLRREPDAAGYQFWLAKLNEFGGDYIRAEMVKAFITSPEYRQRFTP